MHIYDLTRRQQPAPAGSGSNSENTNDTTLPTYVWITVVLFISIAVTCGVCARRNHRRQFLHRQAILNSQRPNLSSGRNPYAPPWAAFGPFGRVYGDAAGLQPPPRARRRASQASVTSLPVYRENPGAQEVVLLQRTVPKDEDDAQPPPPVRQPTTGADTTNGQNMGMVATSQPIANAPPTLLPTANAAPENDAPPLSNSPQPTVNPTPASSPPPAFSSIPTSPILQRPVDAHHSPWS